MKFVTDIKEANALLLTYKGADAQICMFSISLWRLAIRLVMHGNDEVIYVIGAGCRHLNGNFSFKSTNLTISEEDHDEIITKITDTDAGFELLTSGGFAIAQGLESEFGTSFDNFLIK